jgi:hypothetical protein
MDGERPPRCWQTLVQVALLGTLIVTLSSCVVHGVRSTPNAIGTLVPRPPQRVVTPACGAALGAIALALDPTIPRDIRTIVGFMPVLPANIPTPLTWNVAVIAGKSWSAGPTPMFHAAYGIWVEKAKSTYALHTTVALDEASSTFDPVTNLTTDGGALGVTARAAASVNGLFATLYTLQTSAPSASSGAQIRIDALMWHFQGLTLRLTAVEMGKYLLFPSGANANSDQVEAWAWPGGSSVELFRQLAQHVSRYSGCGVV